MDFLVEPAEIEELTDATLSARELCSLNAESKALEVANRWPGQIVLGADTVVALGTRTLGKPQDLAEARNMLESLCGQTHEVLTGVCLIHRETDRLCQFIESTRVRFRPLEEVDLDAYLANVHPLDKAGAYAAQEDDGRLIECLEGSMSNVIGLPVEQVLAVLKNHFSAESFSVISRPTNTP